MTTRDHSHDPSRDRNHDHSHGARPWELYFAIAAGVTYFSGLALQYLLHKDSWALAFYAATYFFGGFFTIKEAVHSLRRGHFEVDFLMLVAAIGAAAVGKFSEGAVLLFLFSLGHSLEEFAMRRATSSISALTQLAPTRATVKLTDGTTVSVPVEELQPGQVVLVAPNSRVPADGVVVAGVSAVDQSAVTGESVPAQKVAVPGWQLTDDRLHQIDPQSQVFAGTLNGAGALEVVVTAAAQDSTMSRVAELVAQADMAQSPAGRMIDKFQRIYVPVVIAVVMAILVVGLLLGGGFQESFYRAMLVLVAASPCALAIATPAAVLSAIGRAARAGVLVKGASALELLGKAQVFAFDKTGTLTWGAPSVASVVPAQGVSLERLQQVALAVEGQIDHPIAKAISRDLLPLVGSQERLNVVEAQSLTGRGAQAQVLGQTAQVGSLRMMEEVTSVPAYLVDVTADLQAQGQTTMLVRLGEQFLGVIGVRDQPRLESKPTLDALRSQGASEIAMLSGDNPQVARAVADQLGMDVAQGDLLPEDKALWIRRQNQQKRITAVVGDGVNDAPAMAHASVAIAMGAAGSAVALETADIALMSDDLGKVPFVRRLSKATSRTIIQNLVIAMAVVLFLVPASLLGLAIGPVVIIHEGSTLLVIFNALRLLAFERGREHEGIEHEERPCDR